MLSLFDPKTDMVPDGMANCADVLDFLSECIGNFNPNNNPEFTRGGMAGLGLILGILGSAVRDMKQSQRNIEIAQKRTRTDGVELPEDSTADLEATHGTKVWDILSEMEPLQRYIELLKLHMKGTKIPEDSYEFMFSFRETAEYEAYRYAIEKLKDKWIQLNPDWDERQEE